MRKRFLSVPFAIVFSIFAGFLQTPFSAGVIKDGVQKASQNSVTGDDNYKKIYRDILTNFYNTGVIGSVDEFYDSPDVDTYKSIDDSILNFYYFTLADVTGDGQSEIIILKRRTNWFFNSVVQYMRIYKIFNGKAVQIFESGSYSPYLFLDNNIIVQDYSECNRDDIGIWAYDTSICNFTLLDDDKDSELIASAKDSLQNNRVKLSSDSIMDFPVTLENIAEAVEKLPDPGIDLYHNITKESKGIASSYKSLYSPILHDFHDDTSKFKLMDITGDNRDELIVKVMPKGEDFYGIYGIYGIVDDKPRLIGFVTNSGGDFFVFDDNTLLSVDFSEYGTYGSEFHYYSYDPDISRFTLVKEGQYRNGDRDYLRELLKKPIKLRESDIDTDINDANIEAALK